MKHQLTLENAPVIPVPEARKLLGIDKPAMDRLIERQVVIPDIRGNGTRQFMTFSELKRAARALPPGKR